MNAVTRRLLGRLTMVVFAVLIAVIHFGCGDREMILMIEQPTEIHSIDQAPLSASSSSSDSQSVNVQPGKVMTILKAGDTAKAAGVYHGQDHDGFKVTLADGMEGLILAGDTFTVVSR